MIRSFEISTRRVAARGVSLGVIEEVPAALREIGLQPPLATLTLVGGAASLAGADLERLRPLFHDGLAPAIERAGACVVDGGTDAGIMRLMGEARDRIGARFPLIGVVAAGKVAHGREDDAPDAASLEAGHSHFVLVPGSTWGDESPWLSRVAGALAGDAPAVTLVIGGGPITWKDVEHAVAAGRTIFVVAGSGGVADALADALSGDDLDARARELARAGRFSIVDAAAGPASLDAAVSAALGSPPRALPVGGGQPAAAQDDADELRRMIDALDLPATKRSYLTVRWLGQIKWMEEKAGACQLKYHWARRLTIFGSALLPALVSLPEKYDPSHWAMLLVSLTVTISVAWEEFFRNGDRWRHHRRVAEQLKHEGWLYLELSGSYSGCPDHARAHESFVSRVEQILDQDVAEFISRIATERDKPRAGAEPPRPPALHRSST